MVIYSKRDEVEAALAVAQETYDTAPDATGPRNTGRIVPNLHMEDEDGPNWTVDVGEGVSGDPLTFARAVADVQMRMPFIDPAEM